MKVSIIIRSYNRSYIIKDAIESALNQTYLDWEILIVDDGSTDNTGEIVAQYTNEKVRYIRHELNRGVGAACNTGIAAAKGEFIAFLDSDDFWKTDYLERQLNFFTQHPEIGAVFSDVEVVGTPEPIPSLIALMPNFRRRLSGWPVETEFLLSSREMYLCLLEELPIKPTALVVRRELFSLAGHFNENWRSGEDWEFLIRLAPIACFGFQALALAVQRRTPDATHLKWREEDKSFLLKLFSKKKSALRNDPHALEAVRRGIRSHCNNLGSFYLENDRPLKALGIYLKGYKETGEMKMLGRCLGATLPRSVRKSLKRCFRARA